jgi:multidrug resistance efflux pump
VGKNKVMAMKNYFPRQSTRYPSASLTIALTAIAFTHFACVELQAQNNNNRATAVPSSVASIDPSGWLTQSDCLVFAMHTIDVPAKETGYLAQMLVKQNQEIAKGAVIGNLDTRTAELELQLAKLQAQVAGQEAADESDVMLATSILDESRNVLENYQTLVQRQSATETEFRQKQIAVTQSEVKLVHAKQTLEQMKLRARVAQASVLASDDKLQRLQISSPMDATVYEVLRKEGEWVQAGQPVCRLVRINELRVDFFVQRAQLDPALIVGRPVQVSLANVNAEPTVFAGQVTSYDPEVTSQGRIRVHATIQNLRDGDHWRLLPGMTVTLRTQPAASSSNAKSAKLPESNRGRPR